MATDGAPGSPPPRDDAVASAGEAGIRHQFLVTFKGPRPTAPPELLDELLAWCAVFDREGLAPVEGGASAGNLSCRTPSGLVITPTRSRLKSGLGREHLVEVVRADLDAFAVEVLGTAPPSSDTFLHERIYAARPDAVAVFHGHDPAVLRAADALARDPRIVLTSDPRPFGTPEDAVETARELGAHPYIIRRDHGFVAVGRTLEEAGALALEVHRRAVAGA